MFISGHNGRPWNTEQNARCPICRMGSFISGIYLLKDGLQGSSYRMYTCMCQRQMRIVSFVEVIEIDGIIARSGARIDNAKVEHMHN